MLAALARHGVLARNFRDPSGYQSALRITVGLPAENQTALAALAAVLGRATNLAPARKTA